MGRKEAPLKQRWMYMVGGAAALAGLAALVMQPGIDAQKPATASAAGPEAKPATATVTEAARITPEELKAAIARKDVVVIDTRSADAYAHGHIPGAISMSASSVEARLGELPKQKLIAAYCT